MKKFITVLIIIPSSICIFATLTKSTSFNFEPTNLRFRSDYSSMYDQFPPNHVKIIKLEIIVHLNNTAIDISGEYIKNQTDSNTKKRIDDYIDSYYIPFANYDNTILCFSERTLYIITANNYESINTFEFIYNDNSLRIYDEFGHCDVYNCTFKYNDEDFYSNNSQISNNINDDTNTSTGELKPQTIQESESKFISFLKNIIIPWLWEIVCAVLFSILICVIIFSRMSFILYRKYKKNLKTNIFPREHTWFGNNTPTEIYISTKVFIGDTCQEYGLLEYFSSAIMQDVSKYVILGNAGEGKTFSLSRLILALLDCFSIDKNNKNARKKIKKLIPVLLNFSQLSDCKSNDDLINVIYKNISDSVKLKSNIINKIIYFRYKSKMINTIEHYLNLGRFILLIDGYDEIANTEDRLHTSKMLMDFMNEFDKCNFIMTSRTQIYEKEKFLNISPENTLYLSPLTKEQIHKFVSKWNFPNGKSSSDLFQRIVNTKQLEGIITNPLLLTMVTHTYSSSNISTFNSKTELYKSCCNCLLSEWENNKVFFKRIIRYNTIKNPNIKIELLSSLAYELYLSNSPSLEEERVLQIWANHPKENSYFHGQTQNVLDDIINQSSILERTNDSIRFRHKSFYEYFIALYFSQNNYDIKKLYENILSNLNILFFYFSLVPDEKIVTDFILNNSEYKKLICDIILERHIKYNTVIENIVDPIIDKTSFINLTDVQTLGYIAKQYPVVAQKIEDVLLKKLSSTNNKTERINVLIGLLIFCNKELLSSIFDKYISKIDIEYLVEYSGESINDFACLIVQLLEDNDHKINFIESLAKSFRFDAIYNIYNNSSNEIKDFAVIGLLYMGKEPELLNWLYTKKFADSITPNEQNQVNNIKENYGWENDRLSDEALTNLYTLTYLSSQVILNGFRPNMELVENKLAFLLCLLISDSKGELYYELLNIDNLYIKSYVELTYHWNLIKRSKKKSNFLRKGIIDTVSINRIIIALVLSLILIQMLIIVINCSNLNELSNEGWIFVNINSNSLFPFNTLYILMIGLFFMVIRSFNELLKKFEYNFFTITASFAFSLITFILFCIVIYNITFRLLTLLSMIMVSILEIIKHKNNYPSLKEPQYSKIINFLNDEYHFNDIHIG